MYFIYTLGPIYKGVVLFSPDVLWSPCPVLVVDRSTYWHSVLLSILFVFFPFSKLDQGN